MKNDHRSKSHNITAHTTIQTRQVQKPKLGQLLPGQHVFCCVSSLPEFSCYREFVTGLLCTTRYTYTHVNMKKCSNNFYFYSGSQFMSFNFVCLNA